MIKNKVETNNKQVQTIIHCYPFILTSNKDLVNVKCNRSCQTAASTRFDKPNSDLYPLLEFTPYQLILEGAVKEIDLPRKSLLHWKSEESLTHLSNLLPERNYQKIYKSSLKKNYCITYKTSSMSLPDKHKLSIETNTQTDISVSPHILHVDEIANVFAEVAMQTTITCLPEASVSTILPQLKSNLIHEKRDLYEDEHEGQQTTEDMSLELRLKEIDDIVEIDKLNLDAINTYLNVPMMYETDEGTEDTDEFEETVDYVETTLERTKKNIDLSIVDSDKIKHHQNSIEEVQKDINELYAFKGNEIWDGKVTIEARTIIQPHQQFKNVLYQDELELNELASNKVLLSELEQDQVQQLKVKDEVLNNKQLEYQKTDEQNVQQTAVQKRTSEMEQKAVQEALEEAIEEALEEADQEANRERDNSELNEQESGEFEPNEAEVVESELIESEQTESEQNETEEKNQRDDDTSESKENVVSNVNNCSCGSNALKKIADQLRNQAGTIQLTPEILSSNEIFDENILEALHATMIALQSEMAKLIDAFSNRKDIASTSCNCIDSPINAKETIKITVDEHRNTLQIKLNQYTEIDEFHLSRNAPGDHVGHTSNHVECECQPLHAGAAPPYLFAQSNAFITSSKNIKPRSPIVPSRATSVKSSCCNKISTHQSRIPTPLANKLTTSIRGKRSIIQVHNGRYPNKTCCKDKSTGVQTELTLGDRLQSESLNSLSECGSGNRTPWNNISLPPPGTYSIKSTYKICPEKGTSARILQPPISENSRFCGAYTKIPWNDILLPQANIFKNVLSQGSCSFRDSALTVKDKEASTKLSKPSIKIKLKSSNTPLSKSCTNSSISYKINAKPTASAPEIENKPNVTIFVKIVSYKGTEIIKEMYLKPGDNTVTVNLNDIPAEHVPNTSEEKIEAQYEDKNELQQEESKNETEQQENDKKEFEQQEQEKESNDNNDDVVDKQKSFFVAAECSCKNRIKLNTFKPDFVMTAMETCEAEMKPLRQALEELQMKVRELNIPELKGCMCTVALEEYSKCKSTLGTGRPDPANFPHIKEPSILNTFGPCAFFKPASFYNPEVNFPFGKLPPPVLTQRKPINASTYCNQNYKDDNKKKHHSCICKKKKTALQKPDIHKKTKTRPCEAYTNTENNYEKESKSCMFVSTLDMNSPFMYKPHLTSYENGTNKKLSIEESSPTKSMFKFKSKDSTYKCGIGYTDHDYTSKQQTMGHNKDTRKHKKRKYPVIPHFKKHDFDFLGTYHSVFDVQNLRPGQAVKTDPDDFLLPYNESVCISDFQSPHSLLSSIFSKASSIDIV